MKSINKDYNYYRSYSLGSNIGALVAFILIRDMDLAGPIVLIVGLARFMGEVSNYKESGNRKCYIYILRELVLVVLAIFLTLKN